MNLEQINGLKNILNNAWSKDTAYPTFQNEWSVENPSLGQCAITAMVVQDLFGGDIYKIYLNNKMTHYFNVIDGEIFDFTKDQFSKQNKKITYDNKFKVSREYCTRNKNTMQRYFILKKNIKKLI